jgi:hypothetical protein
MARVHKSQALGHHGEKILFGSACCSSDVSLDPALSQTFGWLLHLRNIYTPLLWSIVNCGYYTRVHTSQKCHKCCPSKLPVRAEGLVTALSHPDAANEIFALLVRYAM